jgi:hypothetical protein
MDTVTVVRIDGRDATRLRPLRPDDVELVAADRLGHARERH